VFRVSGEDIDFTEIKKSTKESKQRIVEERAPIVAAFVMLRMLQLTGEVPTIISFLRPIASPLMQLELVIEDRSGLVRLRCRGISWPR
jgi:hypothetical protein